MDPIRVMLVDDNPTFLHIATSFLKEHYRDELEIVGTARAGEEALVQVRHLRPHVVLMDLAMPGMGGLEAIRCLNVLRPGVGIIALTLLGDAGYREAALAAGADEFVSKQAMITDLLPAIRRVAHARIARRFHLE